MRREKRWLLGPGGNICLRNNISVVTQRMQITSLGKNWGQVATLQREGKTPAKAQGWRIWTERGVWGVGEDSRSWITQGLR